MTEWGLCHESGELYFGRDWQHHRRYCKRLQTDIEARMKKADSVDEFNALTRYNKAITVLVAVCNYVGTHSMAADGLAECLDTQNHFVSLEPVVSVRSPDNSQSTGFAYDH